MSDESFGGSADNETSVYDAADGFGALSDADFAAVSANNLIELKSVGIDIGSSTSHLMFSRLLLLRQGLALSSKFKVIKREVVHKSDVLLTPFSDPVTIDMSKLEEFINRTYDGAGISAEQIDTGAVIATGEAVKKVNAEAIVRMFSDHAGKFVCATAGHNLEAVMAAYGSGAVARSTENGGQTVLNVDVGGGTSKLAIAKNGCIVDTASTNVGARLVATDKEGRITRIEEAGHTVGEAVGLDLKLGGTVPREKRAEMARVLADCLFAVVERKPLTGLADRLMVTPNLTYQGSIDCITFSGGVSEYIYGRETADYGDIGIELGKEIREKALRTELGIAMEHPLETIRATVIGAAQYTLQVSGSTIHVSKADLLPLRNLQVIGIRMNDEELTPQTVAAAIGKAFQRFDLVDGDKPVALAIRWSLDPLYQTVKDLCEGLILGLKQSIANKFPVVLVFDADIGGLVGNILTTELGAECDIVSVDEIDLEDFDFVDIGEELPDVKAIPVVIKSLVFSPVKEKGFGVVPGVVS